MILLDVNVLVYAFREEMPQHPRVKLFVDTILKNSVMFGVPQTVLQSVVRVLTLPSFRPPTPLEAALDYCQAIISVPRCHVIQPTEHHWTLFDRLCREVNARGRLIADAYLATFALDRDDEWVSCDAHFRIFPGLRWRRPWDAQATTNPR